MAQDIPTWNWTKDEPLIHALCTTPSTDDPVGLRTSRSPLFQHWRTVFALGRVRVWKAPLLRLNAAGSDFLWSLGRGSGFHGSKWSIKSINNSAQVASFGHFLDPYSEMFSMVSQSQHAEGNNQRRWQRLWIACRPLGITRPCQVWHRHGWPVTNGINPLTCHV